MAFSIPDGAVEFILQLLAFFLQDSMPAHSADGTLDCIERVVAGCRVDRGADLKQRFHAAERSQILVTCDTGVGKFVSQDCADVGELGQVFHENFS